jgi:hypothetical protein
VNVTFHDFGFETGYENVSGGVESANGIYFHVLFLD